MTSALFYATSVSALLLTVIGCSATSSVTPEGCTRNVQVTVLPGPVFAWSPACGMSSLSVVTVSSAGANEQSMWGFSVSEQKPIGPAVAYGSAPAGATVWTQP